jgi:DNA repair protein SbcC/Rad50
VLSFKLKDRLEKANTKHQANLVSETVTEDDLEDKKLKLEVMISSLEGLRSTAELLEAGRQKILHDREKLEIDSKAISALRQSEITKSNEFSILQAKLQEAQKARDEMLSSRTLDKFRNKLVEGEDCPLCGSKHHPYVHAYAKELGQVENDFVDAEKALEKGRAALQEVRLLVVAQSKSYEFHEKQLRDLELNEKVYLDKIKAGEAQLGAKGLDSLSGVSELLTKCKASLDRIKLCTQFVAARPVFKQVMQDVADYGDLKSRSFDLTKKVTDIYSGSDIKSDCQKWRNNIDQLIGSRTLILQSIDSAEKHVTSNLSITHRLELEIIPSLKEKGFSDLDSVKSGMIDESIYHDLNERQNKIKTELSTSRSLLDADKVSLSKESEKDDPTFELKWADEKIQMLKSELETIEKNLDDVKVAIRTDQQHRDELKKGDEEMLQTKNKMRPWELLNGLIGDSTGNKFNEFAQKLTLQHLLRYANNRLVKLHSRYELSMPEEDEDDDLVVLDTHMGSERRSVKTLSGGETFVISLALALGLSDLASRDIRIDSLFVDEGFGTLDADTLEQSISTLEQLQAESNKMVGIISHVESLKERIYTQVRLDKQSSGYSSLSIFPEGQENTE